MFCSMKVWHMEGEEWARVRAEVVFGRAFVPLLFSFVVICVLVVGRQHERPCHAPSRQRFTDRCRPSIHCRSAAQSRLPNFKKQTPRIPRGSDPSGHHPRIKSAEQLQGLLRLLMNFPAAVCCYDWAPFLLGFVAILATCLDEANHARG